MAFPSHERTDEPPLQPRTTATAAEREQWGRRRMEIGTRVAALTEQGVCYQCEELAVGGVLGEQFVITDQSDVRVVLASDPRAPGHTIVVWKRHAHDFTELDDQATARLFIVCRDVARALERALQGVERVYQVTMCDGPVNHLHIQLIPRYAGAPIGSTRLVDTRQPVLDGDALATAVRRAYELIDLATTTEPGDA